MENCVSYFVKLWTIYGLFYVPHFPKIWYNMMIKIGQFRTYFLATVLSHSSNIIDEIQKSVYPNAFLNSLSLEFLCFYRLSTFWWSSHVCLASKSKLRSRNLNSSKNSPLNLIKVDDPYISDSQSSLYRAPRGRFCTARSLCEWKENNNCRFMTCIWGFTLSSIRSFG